MTVVEFITVLSLVISAFALGFEIGKSLKK